MFDFHRNPSNIISTIFVCGRDFGIVLPASFIGVFVRDKQIKPIPKFNGNIKPIYSKVCGEMQRTQRC